MLTECGKKKIEEYLATGDMALKCLVKEIMNAEESDDGTPGLGSFLREKYILPAFKLADKRYEYIMRTANVVGFAKKVSSKHTP